MLKKLRNFFESSSGNFAVTGAILVVPVMASLGAAVDYTIYVDQKNSVQQALDAAGLAAGRHMNTGASESELEVYAEAFFKANLDDGIKDEDITFDFALEQGDSSVEPAIPTSITLDATLTYDTLFGGGMILGEDEFVNEVTSQIALGNRTVEIALVMDNSGSMGSNNRLQTMKTETLALVETIFNASTLTDLPDPVKFSVVPFAGTVNIGTSNWNRKYMDRKGWSSIAHENFDWNTYETSNETRFKHDGFQEKISGSWDWLTRVDVFDMMGVEWGGCVEMRPWPYNTTDEVVFANQSFANVMASADADGDGINDGADGLFVHYFAPDEPDRRYAWKSGSSTYHYTDDDSYRNDYIYDWKIADGSRIWANVHEYAPEPVDPYDQKDWDDQINRTNWMFKYQSGEIDVSDMDEWEGPNYGCTIDPITELTTVQNDIDDAINAMDSNGITNIQQGLTWGWRTLSDNEPFTTGREDDDNQNIKYIVLLTDGNNYYSTDGDSTPNQTSYGAWGYARTGEPYNPLFEEQGLQVAQNRWIDGLDPSDLTDTIYSGTSFDLTPESSSDFELIMNAHTNQSCNNVKNDGISIFTIAFDVSDGSSVKYLLNECSGSGIKNGSEIIAGGTFYYDVDGGELEQAMENIANQIADMRIVQ